MSAPVNALIDTVCNICMAAGGIGTVGTLIYMISDSRKKSKQIDSVQKIQSHQLETLYQPDLRLISWTYACNGMNQNDIVVENHGEDLAVADIKELSKGGMLNTDGIKGWFPYHWDKGQEIHIPILVPLKDAEGAHEIVITCFNKLGLSYLVTIHIIDGKPIVEAPVKK